MPYWLQIPQGLLTPLIAIITTYIAWQQWQATKLKMNLERYERRLKIYQETHKFISEVITDLKPELPQMYGFYSATAEADFICPPQIREYLDEIFSRALKLRSANVQYKDYTQEIPSGYDHNKICKDKEDLARWFIDQPKIAKEKFKPLLNITR